MSNKVCCVSCSALYIYILSVRSFVSSVFGGPCWWKTSNFMKLVLVSHTAFSLWVYITRRDSPSTSHFSQNTSFSENVCSFFCIGRPCRLTTSESNGAADKWLPPWQTQRPWSNISTFFSVNRTSGRVLLLFHNYNNDWFTPHYAQAERIPTIQTAARKIHIM